MLISDRHLKVGSIKHSRIQRTGIYIPYLFGILWHLLSETTSAMMWLEFLINCYIVDLVLFSSSLQIFQTCVRIWISYLRFHWNEENVNVRLNSYASLYHWSRRPTAAFITTFVCNSIVFYELVGREPTCSITYWSIKSMITHWLRHHPVKHQRNSPGLRHINQLPETVDLLQMSWKKVWRVIDLITF